MAHFRLTVEYDGTDFHGWQVQPGVRTVAGVLGDALHQVTGERPTMTAAGRTDAGAHAHAQVAGVELGGEWSPDVLRAGLNAVLPDDVAVVESQRSAPGFHARRDALTRTYRYVVVCRDGRSPLLRRHAWQLRGPVDVEAMREAARALQGTHDFRAFGGPTHPGGSTVRTIHSVTVEHAVSIEKLVAHETEAIVISVQADAFLRGMMRAIAGALVAVGRGLQGTGWVGELLQSGAVRPPVLTVAPARGLHQWAVTYAATPEAARAA